MQGSAEGVINGSFLMFTALFLGSLVFGRAWCGWLCPGAGLQELCAKARGRKVPIGKPDWIKWFIWVPWIAGIAALAIVAGGYTKVVPLYMFENGISVSELPNLIVFIGVVALIAGTALGVGRRAFCHYECWMAPFMIVGRKISNAFRLPALRLRADGSRCEKCGKCAVACPMSLPVGKMVRSGDMEHTECVLCGTCVDTCPNGLIEFSFSRRYQRQDPRTH
jgi:polyferredoxin